MGSAENSGNGADIKYVVRGALVACDKGSSPSRLNLPKSHGAYFKDCPVLIDTDRVPGVNVMPFGACSIRRGPCMPATAPYWNITKEDTLIKGRPALLTTSTLVCIVGGAITVKDAGQTG